MPSIEENLKFWSLYDWSGGGDEWSEEWGNSECLWNESILPRIKSFVPTGTILEIAPGYGRITHYLCGLCQKMTAVDLVERCVSACRDRYRTVNNVNFYLNDGKSLDMIPDGSIDFVFSWDSLVHSESDTIKAYINEISKKLTAGGVGFIHHSNLGTYIDKATGRLSVENIHMRAPSVSAELFAEYCNNSGMQCIRQEIINWGGMILNDCFSSFALKNSEKITAPTQTIINNSFNKEMSLNITYRRLIRHILRGDNSLANKLKRIMKLKKIIYSRH